MPFLAVKLGLKTPSTLRAILSFVSEEYPERSFADKAITIPCVNPERTFLEKLFLLHEEFMRLKEKIISERMSRHIYDLVKIYESQYFKHAFESELIENIIEHRRCFNKMCGVDYDSLYPPNLNPIPPLDMIYIWKEDYIIMQTNMIPDASPDFLELLTKVKEATARYNKI